MLEITVKTLDGKNKSFSVPDEYTVQEFKRKIATSIDIQPEQQRLIFHGKILTDEKQLKEFDINGKVIHVVQRQAPTNETSQASSSRPTTTTTTTTRERRDRPANSGNFRVMDAASMQEMMQNILSGNIDNGRSVFRTSDGNQVDLHVNMRVLDTPPVRSEAWGRLQVVKRNLRTVTSIVNRLDDNNLSVEELERLEAVTMAEELQREREEDEAENRRNEEARRQGNSAENREEIPENPPLSEVADVIDSLLEAQRRLIPHVEKYRDFLRQDTEYENSEEARRVQAITILVNESLHGLSHALHSLTDLMVDIRSNPPRVARANAQPVQPMAATVIQQTIPVQASINFVNPGSRPSSTNPTPGENSDSSNTAQNNSSSSSSDARSQPYLTYTVGQPSFSVGSMPTSTTAASGTSTNPTPAGGMPSFFQNLFRNTIQRGSGTRPTTSSTIQSSDNQERNEPNSSSNNQSSAPVNEMPVNAAQFPRASRLVDRYLPCHSRFFRLAQRSEDPNSIGRDMVNEIMQTLNPGQGSVRLSRGTGTQGENTQNIGTSTIVPPLISQQPIVSHQQNRNNVISPTRLDTTQPSTNASSGNNTMQLLTSITRLMSEQMTSGSHAAPMSQLLSQIGHTTTTNEENLIFVDVFNIVMEHMGVMDLIGLIQGQHDLLNRIRIPLREYVMRQLFTDGNINDVNMSNAVDKIMSEIEGMIESGDLTDVSVKDNIDLLGSLRKLTKYDIHQMLEIILDESSSEYGFRLGGAFVLWNRRILALIKYSLTDSQQNFNSFIQRQLSSLFATENDPNLRDMMMTMASMQIRQIASTSNINYDEVKVFIVYKEVEKTDEMEVIDTPINNEVPNRLSNNENELSMDTSDRDPPSAPISDGIDPSQIPNLVHGSNSWHDLVNRDWVDVIHRDSFRQDRLGREATIPFSDGYISAMPTKRRKIVEQQKEETRNRFCEDESGNRLLVDTLEKSIKDECLNPITSVQSVMNDVRDDIILGRNFQAEFKNEIESRLNRDNNFDEKSFPNAKQFFGKYP